MELEGIVRNGVIVVATPLLLQEGSRVKVVVDDPSEAPTLRERLLQLAGTVDDLPTDMARNHNHYIHGTPKR